MTSKATQPPTPRLIRLFVLCVMMVVLIVLGARPAATGPRALAQGETQGDVNCDSAVNSIDSLQILRSVAGLGTPAACLADAGDVNCDAAVNSVDSLRILRHVAGLTNTTPDGCVLLGEPLAPPPTSEALIAKALEGGDVTYEESLLYRAYALYDHPDLPDEYRSPVPNMNAAMDLFGEIDQEEGGLTPGLLTDLAPFRVRPADPASIFNNPPDRTGAGASAAPTWVSKPVSGAAALVWVKESPDAESQLTAYAVAVGKVWARLPGIFTYPDPDLPGHPTIGVNPDSAIDFYFVDASDLDPRIPFCVDHPEAENCRFGGGREGYAQRAPTFHDNASSGYVVLDSAASGDNLLYNVAHELTHAAQFAYDVNEASWLMESTAAWSAYRVLKELGTWPWSPYAFARQFLHREWLQLPLTRDIELSAYESWPFFLFASMEKGDGIVTKIWETASAPGQQGIEAVNDNMLLDDYFDDFSVRNWNQNPVLKQYKTTDRDFPADTPKPDTIIFFSPEQSLIEETLEPLSAHYYSYTFQEPVHTIVLKNKLNGKPHAHIWGIAKIDGEWQAPQDWTALEEKTWCRDLPSQNLEELIIVFSNSDKTGTVNSSDSYVEAKADRCNGWTGTVEHTFLSSVFGDTTSTTRGTITFVYNDNPLTAETEYKVLEGSLTHTYEQDLGQCTWYASGTTGVASGELRVNPDTRHYLGYAVGQPVAWQSRCGGGASDTSGNVQIGWYEIGRFLVSEDGKTLEGSFTTQSDYEDSSNQFSWRLVAFGEAAPAPTLRSPPP